jgi:hypothetical protein
VEKDHDPSDFVSAAYFLKWIILSQKPLPVQGNTKVQKIQMHIHVSGGIRTYDPGI